MTLRNRVDPWGNIHAVAARGSLLGNRGILHDESRQIVRQYQHQSWVTCKLSFKNRKRKIMSPNAYTELFFLDEATAFAAGHRPCGQCQRARYNEFINLWVQANFGTTISKFNISEINKILHKERIYKKKKVTYEADIKDLPDGTMFSLQGSAYLVFANKCFLWSFTGYQRDQTITSTQKVDVLTPISVVKTFEHGFLPRVHDSIRS